LRGPVAQIEIEDGITGIDRPAFAQFVRTYGAPQGWASHGL